MATVNRRAAPSMDDSYAQFAPQIAEGIAGVDIPTAACPCYIDSNGVVQLSDGTATGVTTKVRGFSSRPAKAGQPITLVGPGVRFGYADPGTLTPGTDLFLAAAPGRLADAATTGGTTACAFAVNDTDIVVMRYV